MTDASDIIDCAIVGGGPAGLTAAIYLARFHLGTSVIDAGQSRANLIHRTYNHAGFPRGISGPALLRRMSDQAARFGATIAKGRVNSLDVVDGGFLLDTSLGSVRARAVLIATGVRNNRPDIEDRDHDLALRKGLLRYCPICDGFEATDSRIGVIGTGERGMNEALFLRSYSADVTLLPSESGHDLDDEMREKLAAAEVKIEDEPARKIAIGSDGAKIVVQGGAIEFDSIYPALGSVIHSDLARKAGASVGEDGCISVDAHQRCGVNLLFAAGDVVRGLDQISHAMGEGGVAATTIRNDLAALEAHYR